MRKSCIILIAAAVLCFVGLWTYVQSGDFEHRIRPFVETPLRKALGGEARIGRIKASLAPLSLEVRDIALAGSGKKDPVLIRKVIFYLNPFPLLYRTISLSSVTVLEPRVTARRAVSGEIDLAALFATIRKNIEAARGGARPSHSVSVGTISIRNGKVNFSDAGSGSSAALSRLNMKVSLGKRDTASLRVSSGFLAIGLKSHPVRTADVQAVAGYDQGRIKLDSLKLGSEEGRFSASGSVAPRTGEMDLNVSLLIGSGGKLVSLLKKKTAQRTALIETEWTLRGTFKDPEIAGTARASGVPLGGLMLQSGSAKFAYRDRTGTMAGTDWEISREGRNVLVRELTATVGVRSSGVDVLAAAANADDAFLNAHGSIDGEHGYDLAFTIECGGGGATVSALTGIDVSGVFSLRGSVTGPIKTPETKAAVTAGPLAVRGVVFQAVSGAALFQREKLSLSDLAIHQDASRYLLNGSIDFSGEAPKYDARLRVIKSDVVGIVALFYKRIPLDLSATGELSFSGTSKEFSGAGKLDLGPGVAYGEPFDKGTLTVDLSTTRVTFTGLELAKSNGAVSGTGWIGFNGTYSAHVQSRGVDLSEVKRLAGAPLSGPFTLDIRSSGSFSEPLVNARVETGMLTVRRAALGEASCDLEIKGGNLSIGAVIGDPERRRAEARGEMRLQRPYPWSLRLILDAANMNLAGLAEENEFLERIGASARGEAELRGQGGQTSSIHGTARFSRIAATLDDYQVESEGDVEFRVEAGSIFLKTLTLAGADTRISVSGSVKPGENIDLSFRGDANLSLLRLFHREVEHGDGTASVSVRIRDHWSAPDISGELAVQNGQIKIRDIPQKFTSLTGTVAFDRESIVSHGISGEVGGGTVALSGSATLSEASLRDFSARAVIDNVTVRYPQGLTAVLGGSLYYDGDRFVQTLSGEVVIQRGRYEKRVDWKSMLVDFRSGFAGKKQTNVGWIGETRLNVHFYGRESVLFESNLAKIPIDADMLLGGTVDQPQFLGRLEARKGEVYFRKNVFRILHASADFADPNRINPMLDVQAETRVREYQIRLSVSGAADRAFVSFVSDPPLTDANILALLTIGRKSEELKGKEAGVGVGEAASFMTGKFQDLLESRARSLTGLDRFQVDPYISKTDVSVPRVTVGKEIVRDKVFMTYSSNVGAATPEQLFRIEYFLNRSVSLVGERNETGNIGADLKFRFEFR